MQSLSKDEQLLAYISKYHPRATVTVFMKLCYLIDLISFQKKGVGISSFQYIRYKYGPFDKKIYDKLEKLRDDDLIVEDSFFTSGGEEVPYYSFNDETSLSLDKIKPEEKALIDEVLEMLKGYGAKTLTEICYKTKPMRALKATLGGTEGINKKLDLALVFKK